MSKIIVTGVRKSVSINNGTERTDYWLSMRVEAEDSAEQGDLLVPEETAKLFHHVLKTCSLGRGVPFTPGDIP